VARAADAVDQGDAAARAGLAEHLAGWRVARDANTRAFEAWRARGKLREQRVGLASAERAP
jgi:hypothetical protein